MPTKNHCDLLDSLIYAALVPFTVISASIKKVIFNNPATIVIWEDGSKTVMKCGDGDIYDPEKGLAMAISKKALGNKGSYYEVFKKWLPKENRIVVITEDGDYIDSEGNSGPCHEKGE